MLISSSEISNNFADDVPMVGAAWALVSAMSYAIYLTLLRRMTDDSLNLPMFFGFVGMFIMLMFWPGLGKLPTHGFRISCSGFSTISQSLERIQMENI